MKYKSLFKSITLSALCLISSASFAQLNLNNNLNDLNLGEVHGNFQADAQYYVPDSAIGASKVPEKMLMNGFANILYTKGKFTAGIRYESYLNALQGYPVGYFGNSIPYRFITYRADELEVTAGSFYEQFGSGLTLRTYEERNLGLDNALDGIRLKYQPVKGIYLKGLIGKQRNGYTTGSGIVRGFDGEIQFNELFPNLREKKLIVSLGGSFVSKYETDNNPTYYLPENVGNSAARFSVIRNNFRINGEYAYKINDPSADNNMIYKYGDAILLQTSYAVKGFAITLSGSRIDNMSFRSERNAALTSLLINYIPALAKQHTYSLLAFYPYASQAKGEMEFSTELNYKIKKGTALGGKYGTELLFNFSGAQSLDTTNLNPKTDSKRLGYTSDYILIGNEVYFRDYYFELTKKISKKWKLSLIYSYQIYNKSIIQKPGYPTIYSNIAVADITFNFKPTSSFRLELQHLSTQQDQKDWAYALLEYRINSEWFIAAGDQYNYANPEVDQRFHYYMGNIGFTRNANRITLSYGKQREGIFCVGGVCRAVPASNGLLLSVTSSF